MGLASCGDNEAPAAREFVSQLRFGPQGSTIVEETTIQYSAIHVDTKGVEENVTAATTTTWTSSVATVATIADGLATAVAPGTTIISVTYGGDTVSTPLDVISALKWIQVTPGVESVPPKYTQSYSALGIYTDMSTQDITDSVMWVSSDPAIASMSGADATGVAKGTVTITAGLDAIPGRTITSSAILSVTDKVLASIAVSPDTQTIAVGTVRGLAATGTYDDASTEGYSGVVTWSTSDEEVATVEGGAVTGVAAGTATITGSFDPDDAAMTDTAVVTVSAATLATIAVTADQLTIPAGVDAQFTATGTFSDASTQDLTGQVTWSSSAEEVAGISEKLAADGSITIIATGAAAGTATITAAFGEEDSEVKGTADLTVTSATLSSITVAFATDPIDIHATSQATATGTYSDNTTQNLTSKVLWYSDERHVARAGNVGGSAGVVMGFAGGDAVVTAKYAGKEGSDTLTVNP